MEQKPQPKELLLYQDRARCRSITYFPKFDEYEIVFQSGNTVARLQLKSTELRILTDMLSIPINWENHGILPDRDGNEVKIARPIVTIDVL
jgi:hypothetical protein